MTSFRVVVKHFPASEYDDSALCGPADGPSPRRLHLPNPLFPFPDLTVSVTNISSFSWPVRCFHGNSGDPPPTKPLTFFFPRGLPLRRMMLRTVSFFRHRSFRPEPNNGFAVLFLDFLPDGPAPLRIQVFFVTSVAGESLFCSLDSPLLCDFPTSPRHAFRFRQVSSFQRQGAPFLHAPPHSR